eukprot:TRINITY_DN7637_c0_g1_i1.p1 TRINITY_DN7637_c0_g1~~TRINITY_DN7637_c0_g1_i1.p1  ORF type:complete len:671 (-),score=167.49 TRINITY_DN7637_c0_g1_i1:51-2063(-)
MSSTLRQLMGSSKGTGIRRAIGAGAGPTATSAAAGGMVAASAPLPPLAQVNATVAAQRSLASAVRGMASELEGCLEGLRLFQRGTMRAAQEYLSFDLDGLDESARGLLEASADCVEKFEPALASCRDGLREVIAASERVLEECNVVAQRLAGLTEARDCWQHYEEKVAGMLGSSSRDAQSLARNREKLDRAKLAHDEQLRSSEGELSMFMQRRTVHARATLHALLALYSRLTAQLGGSKSVAAAFDGEYKEGTIVEIVGVKAASELNGIVAEVARAAEGEDGEASAAATAAAAAAGRRVVLLPGGEKKSLRLENLRPLSREGALYDEERRDESAPEGHDQPSAANAANGAGAVAEAGSASAEGSEVELRVVPESAASGGIVEVQCSGLDAPIAEVFFGGVRADFVSTPRCATRAAVRVPGAIAAGTGVRVEARTARCQRHAVAKEMAFTRYELLGFGRCGKEVELVEGSAAAGVLTIARRISGVVNGLAFTSAPLTPMDAAATGDAGATSELSGERSYYYELEIREVAEKRQGRTLVLGFAWPLTSGQDTSADVDWGRLPETAAELSRAFVLGGDLPRAYLAGSDLGKVTGWRPLLELSGGTMIGALLRVLGDTLRLSIIQDGVPRCTAEATLPAGWGACDPHGVVDVCGTVHSVELRQGVCPPQAAGIL